MAKLKVGLDGLFKKRLEAIRKGLDIIIDELEEIPKNYCRECGRTLVVDEKRTDEDIIVKRCLRCGEMYGFKREDLNE